MWPALHAAAAVAGDAVHVEEAETAARAGTDRAADRAAKAVAVDIAVGADEGDGDEDAAACIACCRYRRR